MNEWVIHKFGGSCLRIPGDLDKVKQRLLSSSGKPLIVVSAFWGVTDRLLRAVNEPWQWSGLVNDLRQQHGRMTSSLNSGCAGNRFKKTLDNLSVDLLKLCQKPEDEAVKASILASGERMSCITVAAALKSRGLETIAVEADELGIIIASNGASIDIERSAENLDRTLLQEGIPVVSGWLGKDANCETKVLDRGGSDLTAAALARLLNAKKVILWKDVPGVLSVSPRWGIASQTIPYLGHHEALALARAGGVVLHAACIEPLSDTGIPCEIRPLHIDGPCTVIGPDVKTEQSRLAAISCVPGIIQYSIRVLGQQTTLVLDSLMSLLHEEAVKVWSLKAGEGSISMFIPSSLSNSLEELLEELDCRWQKSDIASLISLIGSNISHDITNALAYIEEEYAVHILTEDSDLQSLMEGLANQYRLSP